MTRRRHGSRRRRDSTGSSGERSRSELGRDYGHYLSCGRPTRARWFGGEFQCRHCHRVAQVVPITHGSGAGGSDRTEADTSDAKATDGGNARNAAAFMGGTDEVEAVSQQEDYEPRQIEPSAGGVGRPTATLPIDQLEAIDPIQRRELARDRGKEWPTTEEARERLFRTLRARCATRTTG